MFLLSASSHATGAEGTASGREQSPLTSLHGWCVNPVASHLLSPPLHHIAAFYVPTPTVSTITDGRSSNLLGLKGHIGSFSTESSLSAAAGLVLISSEYFLLIPDTFRGCNCLPAEMWWLLVQNREGTATCQASASSTIENPLPLWESSLTTQQNYLGIPSRRMTLDPG
jgi:hypothetical protein